MLQIYVIIVIVYFVAYYFEKGIKYVENDGFVLPQLITEKANGLLTRIDVCHPHF